MKKKQLKVNISLMVILKKINKKKYKGIKQKMN